MLNPQPAVVQRLVRQVLLPCQLPAAGFLRRHEDLHFGEGERQEAQSLQEPAPRREGIRRRIGHGLIMGAAAISVTEAEDKKQGIDEQDIFSCVVCFLAALTRGLFSRVLGADNASCGAIMGTRGEAGPVAGAVASGGGASSS